MTDNRTESHYVLHKLQCLLNIFVVIKAMGRRRDEHTARMRKMEKFLKKFSQNKNKKISWGKEVWVGVSMKVPQIQIFS